MNAPLTNVRSMHPVDTFEPAYTLDKQIAEARRLMGDARWAELNAEWDAPVPHVRSQAVSQWKAGAR